MAKGYPALISWLLGAFLVVCGTSALAAGGKPENMTYLRGHWRAGGAYVGPEIRATPKAFESRRFVRSPLGNKFEVSERDADGDGLPELDRAPPVPLIPPALSGGHTARAIERVLAH